MITLSLIVGEIRKKRIKKDRRERRKKGKPKSGIVKNARDKKRDYKSVE